MVFTNELAETKSNNLVTKSNMLIEANYKLGVVEQKIILCLASNIQPTDSDFKTYTLTIREFHRLLDLKGSPKYTELRQITKEMMQKVFEVRIENKVIQVAWLSYVAYNETEGTIDVRFDPFLRPYLLQLKREFTSYRLENIVKLKSSYSIRIYELLKQYEKLQERTFHLSDLRKLLGAEDIYPAYGNFKQRVLVPAQKELNKKTDISFEIEEIKIGRRVEKVKFIIKSIKKNSPRQLSFHDIEQDNEIYQYHRKLSLKVGFNLTKDQFEKWNVYGNRFTDLLEKIQDRRDIENPIGYITSVLNSLKENAESPAEKTSTENPIILPNLVSYFRSSKEMLPNWFIKDKAIEKIQEELHVDEEEATKIFEDIKSELFNILDVSDFISVSESKEELEQKGKEIEKIIAQLRNK